MDPLQTINSTRSVSAISPIATENAAMGNKCQREAILYYDELTPWYCQWTQRRIKAIHDACTDEQCQTVKNQAVDLFIVELYLAEGIS